jgi:hypothetical protein
MRFRKAYELDQIPYSERAFKPVYVLIYGRRAEANKFPKSVAKRAQMQDSNEFIMTFDRLKPNAECSDMLCVRESGGSFQAISVPPTMKLGPSIADFYAQIGGKEEAAARNPYLTAARRDFLVSRLPYWDTWSRKGGGLRWSGDWE